MSRFRLGFMTHLHGRQPARELYPAIVDLFVAADELGFDTGWVAQHHFSSDEGRLPSPLVFLAAAAARTQRIILGTAIVALPLEDPVRVAEDAAVLNAISGGRLELGLGSGNPEVEKFAAFGKDAAARSTLYAEKAVRLREVLAGDELAPGITLQPPAAGLADRLWESPLSVERARSVAQAGAGILLGIGPAGSVQFDLARAYLDGIGSTHPAAEPHIAVVHAAFPGPDRATVAAELWPGLSGQSLDYHVTAGWVRPDPSPEELLAAMNIHHGTADDIVATIAAEPVLEVASDLILAVQAHSTTVDRAIAGLEVIAADVAPRLGWVPASAPVSNGAPS